MTTRRRFLAASGSAAAAILLDIQFPPYSLLHTAYSSGIRTASIWTYLWDLADEGWTTPLQLMKENGLTHVSLASAYHAGRFLLPHNPKRKVILLEDGTVYFSPTESLYGKVKPAVNSLVSQGEDFAKLVRLGEKAGLGANAWVVCCHNTPLGQRMPELTCVNTFGDHLYHNLCPSNDDVRAYLRAIVTDLAGQEAQRIELEAMQFQGYRHGFHHERDGIAMTQAQLFLLGLCFCRSCLRRSEGKVDLVSIQRYARTTLESYFAAPSDTSGPNSLGDLPSDLFDPLFAWRTSVVTSLASELVDSVSGHSTVLRPLVSFDATARTMVGMDVTEVAGITGGVLMPGYLKDGPALQGPLSEVQKLAGKNEVIVGMQVGLPESGGKAEFLSRMEAAKEAGVKHFNFYNYGLIHLENLGWIKESM